MVTVSDSFFYRVDELFRRVTVGVENWASGEEKRKTKNSFGFANSYLTISKKKNHHNGKMRDFK